MPIPPRRPPELAGKIFRSADVITSGLLTRAELRSQAWRQLFRGVYADRALPVTHRLRCVAVSEYLLPAEAAIAGRSAAALYGAPYDADAPVEVMSPVKFGPMNGLIVHQGLLPDREVVRRTDGIRITTPVRTCLDVARWCDPVEAVALLDALVRREAVSVGALAEYARARAGKPGSARLLKALKLIDGGAESALESRVRVRLVQAGLPVPVAQYEVTRDGVFVARLDLAWPDRKVGVELEGVRSAVPRQREASRSPVGELLGPQWLVLHVTSPQLRDDFDGVVAQLRTALGRRRPAADRS